MLDESWCSKKIITKLYFVLCWNYLFPSLRIPPFCCWGKPATLQPREFEDENMLSNKRQAKERGEELLSCKKKLHNWNENVKDVKQSWMKKVNLPLKVSSVIHFPSEARIDALSRKQKSFTVFCLIIRDFLSLFPRLHSASPFSCLSSRLMNEVFLPPLGNWNKESFFFCYCAFLSIILFSLITHFLELQKSFFVVTRLGESEEANPLRHSTSYL